MGQVVPIFALSLLIALVWLCRESKLKWLAVAVALPAMIIPLIISNLSIYKEELTATNTKSEVSFSFISFSKMSHNKNYSEIAKVIDCNKYDVIQVQEILDLDNFLAANPTVADTCNISVNKKHKQLVTFSAFPVSSYEENGLFLTRVEVAGDLIVSLLNVHAIKAITSSADRQTGAVTRYIKLSENIDGPLIVAGDFNATPFNASVLQMKKHFNHAQVENHFTNRYSTWPAEGRRLGTLGPWIQIDYIFYQGLKSENTFVHNSSYGSDHYPIETSFKIYKEIE